MHINVIRTSASLAAVAAILAASGAARAADCAAVGPETIYVAGSSAVKPFLKALGTALAGTETIVYVSQGSCVGVDDMVNGTKLPAATGNGVTWNAGGIETACDIVTTVPADLGVSDVFPTSCAGITTYDKTKLGDFQGPIQVMNFVVPKASFDDGNQTISAEAAYLVFGFDPTSMNGATSNPYADGTPWTSTTDIWIRGSGSGTQSMLGKAIGVLPGAWALNAVATQVLGKAGDMVTKIGTPVGDADATIGILASNDLDNNRDTIRGLAYQHYGQSCGYWPDLTSDGKDKLNVRTGRYPVWGPLHMLAPITAGKPTSTAAADLIDYVRGDKAVPDVDVVTLETTSNLVPLCAMQVSRDAELGDYTSVNPSCSCYYDTARGGNVDNCVACDPTDAKPCADKTLTCSYGFCEAI
jgi:ABC-type phosphate transport system substrate-binding protein